MYFTEHSCTKDNFFTMRKFKIAFVLAFVYPHWKGFLCVNNCFIHFDNCLPKESYNRNICMQIQYKFQTYPFRRWTLAGFSFGICRNRIEEFIFFKFSVTYVIQSVRIRNLSPLTTFFELAICL